MQDNTVHLSKEPYGLELAEKALIKLLAKQSDATMSGTIPGSVLYETNDFFQNNQRITKALLEEFVNRDPGIG